MQFVAILLPNMLFRCGSPNMFSHLRRRGGSFLATRFSICLLLFTLMALVAPLRAQERSDGSAGIAWRVRGKWLEVGKSLPIRSGAPVQAGSLLQPAQGDSNNSIMVFLPDGQKVLYECFTVTTCAPGFRVPSLYRTPDPFGVHMLARIRASLAQQIGEIPKQFSSFGGAPLPRDEALAVLGPGNRIQVAGLASDLPNGRYAYDLLPLDPQYPPQFDRNLIKKAAFITFTVPSSGLYAVRITDNLNNPRIVLFIAAVKPANAARFRQSFDEAKALMKHWNEYYVGWPIHDFQWAYLESLVLHPKPLGTVDQVGAAGGITSNAGATGLQAAADGTHRSSGVTAEPAFSPNPGVFSGDTAVKLRCATPGATIRFTIDSSEPIASSLVYSAPIIVKGTELTIKSYASAPGQKDSAVVTGIFRIRQ